MATEVNDTAADEATETTTQPVAEGRISRLLHWGSASRLRMALLAGLCITTFGGIFATWSYLAHLAVNEQDKYTLARALAALDNKNYDEAKTIIGEMQRRGTDPSDFGGALFVLGAVKAAQADQQWSKDRKRAMHLIAARYLEKARELGVPKRLQTQAQFMVGKSLIQGNQAKAGIEVLTLALHDENLPTTTIHELLAEAYQSLATPDLLKALDHNQAVLDDPTLEQRRKTSASITHADILGRLGRTDEAAQYLQVVGNGDAQLARIKSIAGRNLILQAEQLPPTSPQRQELTDQAREQLREARALDPLNSELTRQAMYWIGKSYEVAGDRDTAIELYDQLSKSYGDTPESLTAMLTKADLTREAGDAERALAGYRGVLAAVGEPAIYSNRLLPLQTLKKKLLVAFNDFVATQRFDEALALVQSLQPLFELMEATELKAQAHQEWAKAKLEESNQVEHWKADQLLAEGRYHRRAAGTAYELLSELRFAKRQFSEDLWLAAENFYQGQSYTHAERLLAKYLRHEARQRQALALLRMGQAQLALGKNRQAIETLTECIEMHPRDATVYQARLECAHALLQLDQGDRAEKLLLTNLVGGNLEPIANEWLDSLFLLGDYLHNSERYEEAIQKLDEAVLRFEKLDRASRSIRDAEKAMLARYSIARSFHSAAEKPAQLAREAKTESERQKNRKLRDENLNAALENYLQVQRMLTLQGHVDSNELERMLLRNCYMMQGSVLFQLKRYEEARKAYANISTLYQNEPFVLESFVHIANCYRRLNKPVKAKGTIEQAKLVLNRLPADTDFRLATNFSRKSWELLLEEMSEW